MFLFGLFLKLDLTADAWNKIKDDPDSPPLFILGFTPWCGHCRALMPAWKKLIVDFESEPAVIIASLNCTREGTLCSLLQIRGYPTFYVYYRNSLTRPHLMDRTYNSFQTEANRLKDLAQNRIVFLQKIRRMLYPTFVFRMRRQDAKSRDIAMKAAVDSKLVLDSRYAFDFDDEAGANATASVFLAANTSIVMEAAFTYEEISAFIGDNLVVPFGDWKFEDLFRLRRLFAIYIPADKDGKPSEVTEWAQSHEKDVLFGNVRSIGKGKSKKMFKLTQAMFPAVVFMNVSASRFHVVAESTTWKLNQFIRSYGDNDVEMKPFAIDESFSFTIDAIWPYIEFLVGCVLAVGFGAVALWLGLWIKRYLSQKQD
jgi:thiol-disulfide isomerase/thioredoxin